MSDLKISQLTDYSPAVDTDVVPIVDTTNSLTKKITWANIKATLKTYFDTLYSTILTVAGKKYYHGVVGRQVGASSPLPDHLTTTTFTLGATAHPISYYYEGTLVNVTTDQTTTLSGAAGLYFIYFNAATGNLLNSTTFPGLTITSNVLVSYVYWNGSNYGVVYDERHAYDRDLQWHNWSHNTIGTRYGSGLTASNNGGTGAGATFAVTSGNIYDEDINFAISAQTTARTWYQTGASTYTFDSTPSAIPYKAGTGSRPTYVDNTFSLVTMTYAANRFINIFVYGTSEPTVPIQFFTETVTAAIAASNGYTSIANARAIPFPSLSGYGLTPELKPLYRFIARADGVIQAIDFTQDDYRTTSSIPFGAGNASTTAAAVSFSPTGTITSTNVQAMGAELDTNKAALAGATFSGAISATNLSGTNSGDNVVASTSVVGLTPIVTAPASGNLNVLGVAFGETVRTDKLFLDTTNPSTQAFGDSASAGTSLKAARVDHKHAMMSAPTSVSGNAGTVTGATFTTSLTVNTGTVTLTGNSANTSVLTIGAGAVSVSGANTGDNATNSTYTTLATTIATANSWSAAQTFKKTVQTVTAMGAQALDGSLGNVFTRTLAASETFTQSNFTAGQCFMVEVTQGSGTSYTVTWFGTVTWITTGGTAPVQTTTTNGITTYGFRCTGTNTFLGYLISTQ